MTFNDLPENWPTLPLTDPAHVADVLDVFVDLQARASGSLLLLLCDDLRRPIQPILIDSIDERRPHRARGFLTRLADTLAGSEAVSSVLCAIARRDGLQATKYDRRWRRELEEAFEGRVELLGVHLVTFDGSVPIGAVDEAA